MSTTFLAPIRYSLKRKAIEDEDDEDSSDIDVRMGGAYKALKAMKINHNALDGADDDEDIP